MEPLRGTEFSTSVIVFFCDRDRFPLDDLVNPRAAEHWIIQTWAQLNAPGINGFSVGLNLNASGVGTGGAATTFVVENIEEARSELISRGVEVSPVQNAAGVLLAFFSDPDGNSLGLRQNNG